MEAIRKDVVDKKTCYRCSLCNKILIKIDDNSFLGKELNHLDLIVIKDHWLSKHGYEAKVQ